MQSVCGVKVRGLFTLSGIESAAHRLPFIIQSPTKTVCLQSLQPQRFADLLTHFNSHPVVDLKGDGFFIRRRYPINPQSVSSVIGRWGLKMVCPPTSMAQLCHRIEMELKGQWDNANGSVDDFALNTITWQIVGSPNTESEYVWL